MTEHKDFELTPEERAALDSLPREQTPSDLLRARIARELKAQGLLRSVTVDGHSRTIVRSIAGVAAALILFLGGVAVGSRLDGTGPQVGVPDGQPGFVQSDGAGVRPRPAARVPGGMDPAVRVQQAGSEYVAALADLVELAESEDDPAVVQGREAALNSLRGAVQSVGTLVDEPGGAQLLEEWEGLRVEPRRDDEVGAMQTVVWF
jgi:hypothetical protein